MSLDSVENDSIGESTISKKATTASNKCSWCDRKRARNDLCNVCRQKVESRARRLMEQKIGGDMDCLQNVMQYFQQNIPLNSLNQIDLIALIAESFPFLMLKFQTEKTYRGKKGNRCWCLPESVLKKLMASFYDKDTQSTAIIKKGGRQELCTLLMNTVAQSFAKYKVNVQIQTTNSSDSARLKRRTMDDDNDTNNTHNIPEAPPKKRARRDGVLYGAEDTNHNTNNERIWGRSDTDLLSFDINKLDSFLLQFEQKVLNGNELERVQPSERIDFLKKRCKEFVKILNELRDYVMHLRVNGDTTQHHDDTLLRCTTNLLSKLSVSAAEPMAVLRKNIPKLEEYHNVGCNELWETVRSIESIGSQMGYPRNPNSTLKQYTTDIELNLLRNGNRNQVPQPTNSARVFNHGTNHPNTYTVHPTMNNRTAFRPPPPPPQPTRVPTQVTAQPMMHQNTVHRTPQQLQPQQMIFTPIGSSYALMNNTNNNNNNNGNAQMTLSQSSNYSNTHRLPLNSSTLNALDIDECACDFGVGPFDTGFDTATDAFNSNVYHQYNVI